MRAKWSHLAGRHALTGAAMWGAYAATCVGRRGQSNISRSGLETSLEVAAGLHAEVGRKRPLAVSNLTGGFEVRLCKNSDVAHRNAWSLYQCAVNATIGSFEACLRNCHRVLLQQIFPAWASEKA